MIDYVFAPVVVANDDWFTVTFGIEGVSVTLALLAQLDIDINFIIVGKGIALWIVFWAPAQRLVRMFQVNDGQAGKSTYRIIMVPRTSGTWLAVVNAFVACYHL